MEELNNQVPLFTFPTVEAPRFAKGYPASVVFVFALWASVMFGIWFMSRRQSDALGANLESQGSESGSDERTIITDKDENDSHTDPAPVDLAILKAI